MSSTPPDLSKWRKVTKKEFFKEIGEINCHPQLSGKYPFTSTYKTPSAEEVGMSVPSKRFSRQYRIPVQVVDFYLPKIN